MEKPFDRRTLTRSLGGLALFACSLAACSQAEVAHRGAPGSVEHRAYRYDGVSGTSQVTHEKAADGRESLRGTTDLVARGSGNGSRFARETVSLDAQGRLGHAELIVGERGAAVQYTLDPSRGAVRVVRPGAPAIDWTVPNDAPWMYAPNPDEGVFIATPVAAWVALRAVGNSDVVRVLEPEQQRTYLMTVDQVVVPTEQGATIALGSDGIDADAQFINELRLLHGEVTLARVSARDLVPRT
jgi:hypothetical protein